MDRMWIRESSFDIKKRVWRCWCGGWGGGGWGGERLNFVCVFGGLWKIGEVKWEGVKSSYRTKGLITWAGLSRFAEISTFQLNDRLAGIPVLWCWDPGLCDQALTVSCIVTQFARETFGIYRDVILNRSFALAHTTRGEFMRDWWSY